MSYGDALYHANGSSSLRRVNTGFVGARGDLPGLCGCKQTGSCLVGLGC